MIFPTLHLNGTSYDDLYEQADTAYNALYEAVTALRATEPHARDYYVRRHGGSDFVTAQNEYAERFARLSIVLMDMQSLRENIMDQKNAHEVRHR